MKMIARIKVGVVVATGALALALPALVLAKDEKIKLEDCPAAVQKTIKENAGDGKIVEVEKETRKDGTVVYEAEVKKADGTEVDIKVAADGKLIGIETDEDDDDGEENDD
jgi:uncharacterized membrane protein YkoI